MARQETTYTGRRIWGITYPVLISLLMEHLIGMTDTAFMGHVGEVELGASAIAGVYYLVLYMIGFGFSVGAEILMGRLNGEGRYRAIGNVFFQGLTMVTVIAVACIAFSFAFTGRLLGGMLSSPAILGASEEYLSMRVWGLLFSLAACMFRAFYMATTRTSILTLNGIVMVLCNVAFNYVLVFGKLGFPALGIRGAAIGSTVAELVSLLFFWYYTRRRTDYRRYAMLRVTRPSRTILGRIMAVSGWTTVQHFISTATWLFFFLAIEHLGERPLAISNIVRSASSFFFMIVSAYSSSGTAIVSNLMGNGRPDRVMPVCRRIMLMCALTVAPLFAAAMAWPGLIARIFTDVSELAGAAKPSMRVMLLSYLLNVPAYVLFFAVSGTGNTRKAFYIELLSTCVYVAYICLVAVHLHSDIAVCWTSDSVYAAILLVCSGIYMHRASWNKTKI